MLRNNDPWHAPRDRSPPREIPSASGNQIIRPGFSSGSFSQRLPSPRPAVSSTSGYGNPTAPCMACSLRNQTRVYGPVQGAMVRPDLAIFNQLAQITECLYLSGARAVNYSRIAERGITCVVNATVELPNLPMPNVDYVKVPVDDTQYSNLYNYFDVVADKINDTRRRGGKTLVHCIAGVSRSATLCIAYLIKYEGMSLRKAYQHVKARRPIAHPNHGFFKQLIDYERRLQGRESVKMVNSAAGIIPDVYEEEFRNIMWVTTYKSDFGECWDSDAMTRGIDDVMVTRPFDQLLPLPLIKVCL